MTRSHRLLAERGQTPQGIVSLGAYDEEPSAAEVFGLYVVPDARGTGVSWRLVEAAAALATQNGSGQLYYWVGTDNGRAIGFAKNFGFRLSGYRRPSRASDLELGEQEVALVLSLEPDTTSVPNPTSGKAATRKAPSAENRGSRRAGRRAKASEPVSPLLAFLRGRGQDPRGFLRSASGASQPR